MAIDVDRTMPFDEGRAAAENFNFLQRKLSSDWYQQSCDEREKMLENMIITANKYLSEIDD